MANARQFERLKSALGPSPDCPPLDQLVCALDASEGDPRRQAAADHSAGCAYCRDEVSLLREFTGASPRPDEARNVGWIASRLAKQRVFHPSKQRTPFFFGMRAWAMAACLAIIAAGAFYLPRGPGAPSAIGIGDGVMRSQVLELTAPVGDVAQEPAEFRWRGVPGAVRYQVHLMEVDLREVWQGDATEAFLVIPASVLALMTPGKTLLWQVSASDQSGRALAASAIGSFRVIQAAR